MRTRLLLKRNLTYFWRTNLAVISGVAAAVAVLAGALVVGDSVRASLNDIFLQRLGRADHVVSSASFFREQLADEIRTHADFASGGFEDASPLVVLEATVTHEESGRRAARVQVYGVDERFWRFHGRADAMSPQNRDALLSESLARELQAATGDALLVRVEMPSAIPAESLHGRKDDVGHTLRVSMRERLAGAAMGEFSVRPQQAEVRAVFVPLRLLQKELEQEGKANALLVSEKNSGGRAAQAQSALLQQILKKKISLEDMGIKLRAIPEQRSISLESESGLVPEALAETALRTGGAQMKMRPARILSYLANTIRAGAREIPYSIVTATDEESFEELKRVGAGQERRVDAATRGRGDEAATSNSNSSTQAGAASQTQLPPIILNEWAARDLEAKPGDKVTLEYYLWQEGGRLLTRTAEFQLAGVIPIQGLAADRNLVPDYPGISGSESVADWDPPFPVDLARVRRQDEDYWDEYRTTPKAFIQLTKGQELWQSRFGKLTSIRFALATDADPQASLDAFGKNLREAVDPTQMGIAVFAARAEGLKAARGATDFGEYFLYFSFFLVASALLLAALFFKLGIEQRLREIGILQATGFAASKIRAQFLLEGFVLASLGTVLGLLGALAYGSLMMRGLRTWWRGAVGTTMLSLHVSATTLIIGSLAGLLAATLCILWTLRRVANSSTRSLLSGTLDGGRRDAETWRRGDAEKGRRGDAEKKREDDEKKAIPLSPRRRVSASPRLLIVAVVFGVVGLALLAAAFLNLVGQAAGFFGGGTALLISLLCLQSAWLRGGRKTTIQGSGLWALARLGFRNATHRPGRSVLCIALIASAAFIIVSVDAFRRDDRQLALDKKSGGGGYPLLAESLLPLVQDPNTPEGRDALNLAAGEEAAELKDVHFARFRLRPGDDASCLNLYQPRSPRILAPTADFLEGGRFAFHSSLAQTEDEKKNPWLLLQKESTDGSVPIAADANSLAYVLHLKLGDEFVLDQGDGRGPVRLRVVAALADSIFQSELLMSEKNFLRLFPAEEGYRFFLMDVARPDRASAVATELEERLSDFGFDVVETNERLAAFHRVENTFISTFQMLGGLGLVLGTLGLGAVLLRNVLERRRELALLRAIGYNRSHFAAMVLAENAFLLLCGLVTGAACASLAIAPVIFSRGGQPPTASLGILLLAVLASGLAASLVATVAALRSPLLPALRAE